MASFADPECPLTLVDLFAKASHPERVFAGICWQYDPAIVPERCPLPAPHAARVRAVNLRTEESRGAGWARRAAFDLGDGEDYVLVVDAHLRFEPGWDTMLIDMLEACPRRRTVLSALLSGYERGPLYLDDPCSFYRVGVVGLAPRSSPQIVHLGGIATDFQQSSRPIASASVVFHFMFARRAAFQDVPIDPHVYFHGDEISHSARLFTHGYDIRQPHCRIAYHRWTPRVGGEPYKRAGEGAERTRRRVRHLLGLEPTSDPAALAEIERYGLGSERSSDDFFSFAGYDPRTGVVSDAARFGRWGDAAGA